MTFNLRRRTLLKTGIAGGLLLSLAVWLQPTLDRAAKRALVASSEVDAARAEVVAAVAPVLLAGMFPAAGAERDAAVRRSVEGVGIAVATLSASSQREVAELFALLALPPSRIAVAGVRRPWAEADEQEIAAFLDRWRHSPIDLLRSGYFALHDLVLGAWYADPQAWEAIGYPGPPQVYAA